jgi:hypothetical protein
MSDSLVVAADIAALDTLSIEAQELAVTRMLDQSRQWLDRALEATNPAREVSEFRAFIATVAEAAKQKKLSEDIQLDAVEMVRRSERALGVAIRKGQAAGVITTVADGAAVRDLRADSTKVSARDFFDGRTHEQAQVYAMTDHVTDEQFDQGLAEARAEGNVSRANVVRKVAELGTFREQQDAKWDRVDLLANSGLTSSQIASEVGLTEEGLRAGARKKGIDFPADRIVGKTRRIDPLEVIEQTVMGLEVTNSTLDLADLTTVTAEQAREWLARIEKPLRALKQFQNNLKGIQ